MTLQNISEGKVSVGGQIIKPNETITIEPKGRVVGVVKTLIGGGLIKEVKPTKDKEAQ